MAKVGIVMGSDSDMPVMSKAADILEKLGIDYEGVRRVAHIHLTYGISWDVVAQLMIKYIKENDLHCTF